ncbi:hypothetical protein DHEL01_v208915 [Diaporthe helianthi]|uniref:Uncharacterized protein n=1 Tax=Diaporthe helianthi TaxID=158607 RepID=A0A2P5HR41_DIAHE|nr:hypothetical protein DHEL01_v208915 [Diaporthe helianthi]
MHTNAGAKQALAKLASLHKESLQAPASTIAGALMELHSRFAFSPNYAVSRFMDANLTTILAIQDLHRSSRPSVTASATQYRQLAGAGGAR